MILVGGSSDGWDARRPHGMFVSPDGEHWGNMPFTYEQAQEEKLFNAEERLFKNLGKTIKTRKDLKKEYKLIKQKKSHLSCKLRNFVVLLMSSKNK